MRIEKHRNEEAIARIRQNVLNFSVDEYVERIDSSFQTIKDTRTRLLTYKDMVRKHMERIEEEQIDLKHIDDADRRKITLLTEITRYLDRSIERHMDIMESYNQYYAICATEMENALRIAQVERFSFSREVFEKILNDATLLGRVHTFLTPLFNRDPKKIFNLNKAFIPQRKREKSKSSEEEERIDFDERAWLEEMRQKKAVRQNRYANCLSFLLECTRPTLSIRLSDIQEMVLSDFDKQLRLIPSISIFKDVMIELIRTRIFDVSQMKLARANAIRTGTTDEKTLLSEAVPIGEILLEIIENSLAWRDISRFTVQKIEPGRDVYFENLLDENENPRKIICSDVLFTLEL